MFLLISVQSMFANDCDNIEIVPLTIVKQQEQEKSDSIKKSLHRGFLQGVESSAKLVLPTVIVTSIVMIMLYKPYCALHQSITDSTKSFEGMERSFAEISQSFHDIKGSMQGSKDAFESIDLSVQAFVKDFHSSWTGWLLGSSKKT